MSDGAGQERIVSYIRGHTRPVQWIGWMLGSTGTQAGDRLGSVLYEPDGATLRDLTDPSVRERVIAVVLASEPLRRVVEAEVECFIEAVVEHLNRGQEPDGGTGDAASTT